MSAELIDNRTTFTALPLFVADEDGRPLVAVVAAAAWSIAADGRLSLLPEQPAIELAGTWWGEPGTSSPRIASEAVFIKPATDIVVHGHAYAAKRDTTVSEVAISVGPVATIFRVSGERMWQKSFFGQRIADPAAFERVPLRFEHAFGGPADVRNPVGRGWAAAKAPFVEGTPLPNLEIPTDPVTTWGRAVAVAGCGTVAGHWEPRRRFAGTYDAAWQRDRSGLLPRDFDRRFFNAATLIAPGHLRGDERFRIAGCRPGGAVLAGALPGQAPPVARISRRGQADLVLPMVLDGVRFDLDAMQVHCTWRCHTLLRDGHGDVTAMALTAGTANLAA